MTHKEFCRTNKEECINLYKEFGDKDFKELAEYWNELEETASLEEIKIKELD